MRPTLADLRLAALSSFVLSVASAPAAADIPGPNDDLCTVEVQAEGGATCEACTVVRTDPETAHACDALVARGWVLRCGRGGTVHTSVYCDRAGSSGGGGGFGCSAAAGAARANAVVMLVLAVVLARTRR